MGFMGRTVAPARLMIYCKRRARMTKRMNARQGANDGVTVPRAERVPGRLRASLQTRLPSVLGNLDILRAIVKAVILVVGVVFSCAFSPNAIAHGARGSDLHFSGVGAIQHHAEPRTLSGSIQGASVYIEAAAWQGGAAADSEAGNSAASQRDLSCCCVGGAHCASGSSAIAPAHIAFLLLVWKASRSPSITRIGAGLPPTPADPPPRDFI